MGDQIADMSRELELEKVTRRSQNADRKPGGLADFARHSRETKKLGDFGFEVNDSRKPKKTNGETCTNGQ